MAQTDLKQSPNLPFNVGNSHSRSLSQPTFFGNSCLPPLSPFPPSESSLASSNSNFKKEEIDVSSCGPALGLTSPRENPFRGKNNNGLPPRKGHRRSNSDVPLGFSAMIQSSPQLVPISGQGNSGRTASMRENSGNEKPVGLKRREMDLGERKPEGEVVDFDSLMNLDYVDGGDDNKEKNESSNSESESVGAKRRAAGNVGTQTRHFRSLSMDSGIGNFHFGEFSPKLSPSNSLSENFAKMNMDFGHGEFNEVEMKKIMADERLAEIAISDPKRAKRILANRQSAARSKERKMRYISELEHKVQTLQTEATTLSAQITTMQKDHTELTNQNNELKFRIQAMEQQAQLRDALHETLTAEVQRLKLANMELGQEGRTSNGNAQMKHHMFPMQQQQRLSVTTSKTSTTSA